MFMLETKKEKEKRSRRVTVHMGPLFSVRCDGRRNESVLLISATLFGASKKHKAFLGVFLHNTAPPLLTLCPHKRPRRQSVLENNSRGHVAALGGESVFVYFIFE